MLLTTLEFSSNISHQFLEFAPSALGCDEGNWTQPGTFSTTLVVYQNTVVSNHHNRSNRRVRITFHFLTKFVNKKVGSFFVFFSVKFD
jgi:hypothetical protein